MLPNSIIVLKLVIIAVFHAYYNLFNNLDLSKDQESYLSDNLRDIKHLDICPRRLGF